MKELFPGIIIALSLLSSIGYAFSKQPLHAGYWFFAAALNTCVLFMKEVH